MSVTEDQLLGGRVRLRQPAQGYRAAIDPVLLAAAVTAGGRDTVLEAGIGAGAASLCLAARVPACRIIGIERDPAMVELARENIVLNGLEERIEVIEGDVADPPASLTAGGADHVMMNPPYLAPGGSTSPSLLKKAANVEDSAGLSAWIRFALAMLRAKGVLTLIYRADRIDALMAALAGRAGEIVIFPLWPKAGSAAKRIIVRARKGIASPSRIAPGLVLHTPDGRYTREAEAILRGGAALEVVSST